MNSIIFWVIFTEDNDYFNRVLKLIRRADVLEEYYQCKTIEELHQINSLNDAICVVILDLAECSTILSEIKILAKGKVFINISSDTKFLLKAFEVGLFDYLVEPVARERINQTKERVYNLSMQSEFSKRQINTIAIKISRQIVNVRYDQILCIQAYGNYIKIITPTKMLLSLEKISAFELRILDQNFIRCHKSFIVNKNHILLIEESTILLTNDMILPIGKTYKRLFLHKFTPISL